MKEAYGVTLTFMVAADDRASANEVVRGIVDHVIGETGGSVSFRVDPLPDDAQSGPGGE